MATITKSELKELIKESIQEYRLENIDTLSLSLESEITNFNRLISLREDIYISEAIDSNKIKEKLKNIIDKIIEVFKRIGEIITKAIKKIKDELNYRIQAAQRFKYKHIYMSIDGKKDIYTDLNQLRGKFLSVVNPLMQKAENAINSNEDIDIDLPKITFEYGNYKEYTNIDNSRDRVDFLKNMDKNFEEAAKIQGDALRQIYKFSDKIKNGIPEELESTFNSYIEFYEWARLVLQKYIFITINSYKYS